MTELEHITGDEPEERVTGLCRRCRQYGLGTYDGAHSLVTDWITDHAGCPKGSG
ncbi:hypothetical protein [Streptomyces sp. NRRL WC-3742]|uniref:hypothetical protein n=1 Tax=Streptomyces sp. NRRL WC-3742 TaxID=1463934 RepID=UPI000A8CAF03|nr:hypothetical protein [Streptomyces sp. NRRL WC-3742]